MHKSASVKALNHNHQPNNNSHTMQATMINWQSLRKDAVSPRAIKLTHNSHTNMHTNTHTMHDRINQLHRLLEQEKASRQKDYLMISNKIKSIKCKHAVVLMGHKQKQKQGFKQKQKQINGILKYVPQINKQSSIKTV